MSFILADANNLCIFHIDAISTHHTSTKRSFGSIKSRYCALNVLNTKTRELRVKSNYIGAIIVNSTTYTYKNVSIFQHGIRTNRKGDLTHIITTP